MQPEDYSRAIYRSRWLILIVTVAFVAVGVAAGALRQAQYTSTAQVLISGSTGGSINDTYTNNLVIRQQLPSYVALVTSSQVLDPAKAAIGVTTPNLDFIEQIGAGNPLETNLIDISFTAETPEEAQEALQAITDQFVKIIASSSEDGDKEGSTVVATITAEPNLPLSPSGPGSRVLILGSLLLGIVVGLLLALLRDRLDLRLRSTADLSDLDVEVLGRSRSSGDAKGESTVDPGVQRAALTVAHSCSSGRNRVVIAGPTQRDNSPELVEGLARSLAQLGFRTLLVDLVGAKNGAKEPIRTGQPGAAGGSSQLATAVRSLASGVDVMEITWNDSSSATNFLSGPGLGQLLEQSGTNYSLFLIWAHSVLDDADALLLGESAAGVVLTVEIGQTLRSDLADAKRALASTEVVVLGALVSGQ